MKKAILIIIGVLLFMLCGLAGLVLLGYKGLSSREPTVAEKSMLITVDALADYGYTNMPRAQCEVWAAKLNIDGTTELEYEYDSDKAPDSEVVHLTSNAELSRTVKDATESYNMLIGALKLGIKITGKADLKAQPELISVGDESYAAIITTKDGDPAGNLVVVRNGRIVHSLILVGVYFDEKGLLDELFEPAMNNSSPDKFGKK